MSEHHGPDPIEAPAGDAEPFVPRPYPRREPAESPLRGRRALVLARDVEQGRAVAAVLARYGCASRHHVGGDGSGEVLASEPWEIVVLRAPDAVREDVEALAALPSRPSLLALGTVQEAHQLGLEPLVVDADPGDWVQAVGRALERRTLEDENRRLRERLADRFALGNVVTRDAALREVLRTLEAVADTRATVLITGETGTGKSMLARAVHACSGRKDGPFVEVNCGALPSGLLEAELFGHAKGAFTGAQSDRPGRFEVADGGTIFLDEVDSAPPELQVKLLRVLQERAFERVGESRTRTTDVRVVVATNADLDRRVEEGTFREDLYWRLNVVHVELPPLRDRPRDLVPLAESFIQRFAGEYGKELCGLDPGAVTALASHAWPGNVRQLEHALERAVLLSQGTCVTRGDLGPEFRTEGQTRSKQEGAADSSSAPRLDAGLSWLEGATRLPSLREALEDPERRIIVRALELTGGRRDRAAKMLDINRSTLFNKMRKYDLLERQFEVSEA